MIRKLAFRSLIAEKFRCVCTIIAMILTALLFSTLFTTAAGLSSANDYYNFKNLGTTAHVVVKDWDKGFGEEVDAIREHGLVDTVGCRRFFGYAADKKLNYNVEISYMDEAEARLDFYTPTGGNMPVAAKEVAMTRRLWRLSGYRRKPALLLISRWR